MNKVEMDMNNDFHEAVLLRYLRENGYKSVRLALHLHFDKDEDYDYTGEHSITVSVETEQNHFITFDFDQTGYNPEECRNALDILHVKVLEIDKTATAVTHVHR